MSGKNNKGFGLSLFVLLLVGLMFLVVYLLRQSVKPEDGPTYSEVMGYFDRYEVYEYTFDLGSGELTLRVRDLEEPITYTVPNVTVFLNEIQTGEANYRIEYNRKHPDAPLEQDYYKIQDNTWLFSLLPTILLIGLMIALFFFMMRQVGGGRMNSFGRANIKNTANKKNTFDDVAGAEEEKVELAEIVDFLKNPKKYTEIGARIPKGVLLEGPPGTGKTLLAKAVAGEAGVPFFSISGSDFVEMFVGVGASRVRDLFETAKKNSPAIVFIDEIDAVGRHRGAGLGGGHDEREQTLNQLLVEMDGFEGNEGVIVVAATNRRDILDPALLRPGRFDRHVVVNYPDIKGREEILKVHTKKKSLGPDVNLATIAKTTAGFTGADLENLVNEAAILAARANKKAITEADIEEASIKVVAGPEKKSKVVTEKDKRMTAYHEGGHAIALHYLETQDKVHYVTIIPRGSAGGFTMHRPEDDRPYRSKRYMEERMVVCLGGRVAEQIIFNDITTGASSDLNSVSRIAREMVTKYGFSEKLGTVVYSNENDEVFLGRDYGHARSYSEEVAAQIDAEVKYFVDTAYKRCEDLLKAHMDDLHILTKYLLKHEKIDGEEFQKLMDGKIPASEYEDSADEKEAGLDVPQTDTKPEEGIIAPEAPKAPEKPDEL
ncbi:MAG: ATP-dependent zinc metalloprotease FtsH [Oscillospiraceae bacterium]|nr:ATP-dependent zinc metalloprotease FtsH [Oscillospiraceae bacterium]